MSDEALRIQDELIRAMSPEQKLMHSQRLREFAWELKAAWIRDRNPGLPEDEVQQRVRKIFLDAGT